MVSLEQTINQVVQALPLSPIYIDFLNYRAKKEFMEGTTAAGKTTIGAIKFMLRVAESKRKYHMIAAADIRYC